MSPKGWSGVSEGTSRGEDRGETGEEARGSGEGIEGRGRTVRLALGPRASGLRPGRMAEPRASCSVSLSRQVRGWRVSIMPEKEECKWSQWCEVYSNVSE